MNDERCDRDRVTAILTLADAAKKALDFAKPSDVMFVAQFQHTAASEAPWLARTLLEALDTIDRLEGENEKLRRHLAKPAYLTGLPNAEHVCLHCREPWPCPTWQALGGNESGDDG